MMRSRALPVNFDMTQALHSPFGAPPAHSLGTPMPSPGGFFSHPGNVRPLTLDTLRRVPDYESYSQHQYASPTGITPAVGAFTFTPPQSATDTMSPSSVVSNFSFPAQQESPRRPPFGLPMGSYPNYGAPHHPSHRLSRAFGEPAGSPLRTSVSYTGLASSNLPLTQPPERTSSLSERSPFLPNRPQRSFTGPVGGQPGTYGLGFSCK